MLGTKPLAAPEVGQHSLACEDRPRHVSTLNAPEVDRFLRKALHDLQLAERNAVLWFGEIHRRKLFRDLGYSSIYQYSGEALGFSRPRTAQFIRLCESLEGLPALRESVAAGAVPWTTAREVAKVATPQTESAWVEVARKESRRRIERRVRMAQTRSRARRRSGGRQLGLGEAGQQPEPADEPRQLGPSDGARQQDLAAGGRQLGLGDEPRQLGPESAANPSGAGATDPPGRQALSFDERVEAVDLASAEVPVSLSLRFTPEQYARYEAIIEKLRKHGERGAREELILAGLEMLLVESGTETARPRGEGTAALVSAPGGDVGDPRGEGGVPDRDGKPRAVRGEGGVPDRDGKPRAVRGESGVPDRGGKPRAVRGEGGVPGREAGCAEDTISPRKPKQASRMPIYQIVVQQCEDCGRAQVLTSRGAKPAPPAVAEAMRCDARVIHAGERGRSGKSRGESKRSGDTDRPGESRGGRSRSIDTSRPGESRGGRSRSIDTSRPGESRGGRNRATIPPGVRREVMARDGHRCRVPGCDSARFLEVHHVVPREAGGTNRPDNLVTLCSACHRLVHMHPLHGSGRFTAALPEEGEPSPRKQRGPARARRKGCCPTRVTRRGRRKERWARSLRNRVGDVVLHG